ncbi:hypothetical protein, partial [Blautia wexlerae]|uniref:hypothetical protein n=3 Tax=Blautia wexlerae TaxID=418240 RepID=UPI001A9B9FDF
LYVSGFWHIHAKTPRGIVVCEQQPIFSYKTPLSNQTNNKLTENISPVSSYINLLIYQAIHILFLL